MNGKARMLSPATDSVKDLEICDQVLRQVLKALSTAAEQASRRLWI